MFGMDRGGMIVLEYRELAWIALCSLPLFNCVRGVVWHWQVLGFFFLLG